MQKRFQPYLQQDFMVVKDALLATVSYPSFKLKEKRDKREKLNEKRDHFKLKEKRDPSILKEKRDKLKQELIDTANKLSLNVSKVFDYNKSSDTYFQWSEDQEETPQTQKNLTFIEVLQYLEDSNTNLELLHRYPTVKSKTCF